MERRVTRYVRYEHESRTSHGELHGDQILPLDGGFGSFRLSGEPAIPFAEVKLLAPATPSKIVAIGPGYGQLPPGMPRPMFWIKPPNCVNDPDGIVEIPPGLAPINVEAELAFVIGKTAKRVSAASAQDHIFGYTCLNDLTSADFSTPEAFTTSHYFVDGKIFDGFAPMGPWIETDVDPTDLKLECRINGEVRQTGSTAGRLYRDTELVAMISNVLTLLPGDIITTGAPPGMPIVEPGDMVEVQYEDIGVLRSYFRACE